jgi:hypothetical protein
MLDVTRRLDNALRQQRATPAACAVVTFVGAPSGGAAGACAESSIVIRESNNAPGASESRLSPTDAPKPRSVLPPISSASKRTTSPLAEAAMLRLAKKEASALCLRPSGQPVAAPRGPRTAARLRAGKGSDRVRCRNDFRVKPVERGSVAQR